MLVIMSRSPSRHVTFLNINNDINSVAPRGTSLIPASCYLRNRYFHVALYLVSRHGRWADFLGREYVPTIIIPRSFLSIFRSLDNRINLDGWKIVNLHFRNVWKNNYRYFSLPNFKKYFLNGLRKRNTQLCNLRYLMIFLSICTSCT